VFRVYRCWVFYILWTDGTFTSLRAFLACTDVRTSGTLHLVELRWRSHLQALLRLLQDVGPVCPLQRLELLYCLQLFDLLGHLQLSELL